MPQLSRPSNVDIWKRSGRWGFFPLFLGRTLATECPMEFARDILILTSWDQDSSPGRNQFHRFVPKDQRLLFGLDKQAGTGSSSRYHSNSEAHLPITGGELKGSKEISLLNSLGLVLYKMSWYRLGLTNIQSAEPGVHIDLLIKIPVKKCSHLTEILPTCEK